ncbi:MAG: hypothetical protein PUD53_03345 [Oscillospiraceae bacterium]|nr:hypothetical protein [Oscillospiraceae bacterium]
MILVGIIALLIFVAVLLYCCVRTGAKAEKREQELLNQRKEIRKP